MSEPNQQYAYFTITGTFDPEDITRRVGIQPTDSWKKGDLHPKRGYERKFSRWSLYSRLGKDAVLEEHVRDVLAQLSQNAVAFQEITKEFGGFIQLVAYYHEQFTGLAFDSGLIESFAIYGLGIETDFYYLWSDEREGT